MRSHASLRRTPLRTWPNIRMFAMFAMFVAPPPKTPCSHPCSHSQRRQDTSAVIDGHQRGPGNVPSGCRHRVAGPIALAARPRASTRPLEVGPGGSLCGCQNRVRSIEIARYCWAFSINRVAASVVGQCFRLAMGHVDGPREPCLPHDRRARSRAIPTERPGWGWGVGGGGKLAGSVDIAWQCRLTRMTSARIGSC